MISRFLLDIIATRCDDDIFISIFIGAIIFCMLFIQNRETLLALFHKMKSRYFYLYINSCYSLDASARRLDIYFGELFSLRIHTSFLYKSLLLLLQKAAHI